MVSIAGFYPVKRNFPVHSTVDFGLIEPMKPQKSQFGCRFLSTFAPVFVKNAFLAFQ
jgi:hypothetical protein